MTKRDFAKLVATVQFNAASVRTLGSILEAVALRSALQSGGNDLRMTEQCNYLAGQLDAHATVIIDHAQRLLSLPDDDGDDGDPPADPSPVDPGATTMSGGDHDAR